MRRASSSSERSRRPPPPPTSQFAARLRSSTGTEQRKKVKFSDLNNSANDLATNTTKTSEFLYFKKLWGNSSNKEVAQTSNATAPKSDKTFISFPASIEKENSNIRTKFISPPKTFVNHEFAEQLNEEEENPTCSGINDTPISDFNRNEKLFPVCKITPLNQQPLFFSPEASRSSDKRLENGGVFSEKRRNLIKLASNTLGVGIDEFSSRRSDLIGELLLRLGRNPKSDLELPCDKYQQSSSSNYYENYGDKIQLKNSNLDSNNLQTLPSIEYNNNYRYSSTDYTLPSSLCGDLAPQNYSFRDRVQVQSQSLVPYGYSNNSYSDLHGFQSPVKQFSPELDIDANLPLALYNRSNFHDKTENFGDFNGRINEEIFYKSPERKWNNALEWKSSPICERKNYSFSPEICDVDFVNARSLVLVKEDLIDGSSGFGRNLQELGSRFSVDGYGSSSSWNSYQRDGFDFDLFE